MTITLSLYTVSIILAVSWAAAFALGFATAIWTIWKLQPAPGDQVNDWGGDVS